MSTHKRFSLLKHKSKSSPKKKETSSSTNTPKLYSYQFLLDRIYNDFSSSKSASKTKKLVLPPPEVSICGPRKILFVNFLEIAKSLNRPIEHFQSFLTAELSCDCGLDGESRLVIQSKFTAKELEKVTRNYVMKYIICKDCRSIDTEIVKEKETRMVFLKCKNCKSERVCGSIKSSFQAIGRGERRAARMNS